MNHSIRTTSIDVAEKIWREIVTSFLKANSPEKIEKLLSSILTGEERIIIAKRLAIMTLLRRGQSYKDISQKLWVSPASIRAIKKMLSANSNYRSRHELARLAKENQPTTNQGGSLPPFLANLLDNLSFFVATFPRKTGPRWRFLTYNRTLPKKYWRAK